MKIDKVLWLEDQQSDFKLNTGALFRAGYIVDIVESVSEALEKLRREKYIAMIFDLKVLPGEDTQWIELDEKKQVEKPNFDSNLGLELLYSLFNHRDARIKLDTPIKINPKKIIVFSVVYDKAEDISAFGVPPDQIIYKSFSNLETLPRLIKRIQNETQT